MGKRIFSLGAVFVALMAVLYGMLALSAALPNDALRENMTRSARYFLADERYAFQSDGKLQNITDNRADQLLVNIAWHMGNSDPLWAALDTDYYDGGGLGLQAGLFRSVREDLPANADYSRYWHGSAAFVRVLHLITDVQGMKMLGLVTAAALALINLGLLIRKKHWELALCLALSLLSVQIWNLGLSITYQPCFLLCFALCPGFVLLEKRGNFPLMALCVISGAATAFFDFLTTETVPLLIPLILVSAIRCKEGRLNTFRDAAKLLIPCIICWVAAYAGAFAAKWAAVSLVTGENHFAAALASVRQRLDSAPPEGIAGGIPQFIAGILANLSVFLGSSQRLDMGRVILGCLLWGVLLTAGYLLLKKPRLRCAGTLAVLALGCTALLRFALVSNHSYLHEFFTYRALAATVLAALTALALNIRLPGRERSL